MGRLSKLRRIGDTTLRRKMAILVGVVSTLLAIALVAVSSLVLHDNLMRQLEDEVHSALTRVMMSANGPQQSQDSNAPAQLRVPGQMAGTVVLYQDSSGERAGYYTEDGVYKALSAKQVKALRKASATTVSMPSRQPKPSGQSASGSAPSNAPQSDAEGEANNGLANAMGADPQVISIPQLGDYLVLAVDTGDSSATLTIVALPMNHVNETVRLFLLITSGCALVLITMAVLAGGLLTTRTLQPLEDLTIAAGEVSAASLTDRDTKLRDLVRSPAREDKSEVGRLKSAFGQMLGHIDEAFAQRQISEDKVRRFAVDASHELRTPLASIKGYAELARRYDDQLGPETARALARVESESTRMGRLVEDLLQIARYDAGTKLAAVDVDLTLLALETVGDVRAADGGEDAIHHWECKLGEGTQDAPVIVRGDPDKLRQVIVNLLGNARNHTPAGTKIELRLSTDSEHAKIEVWDDGPEIPAEFVPRIFERFARADEARTNQGTPSTGLGLAIVEAIVTAHGGTVSVTSKPNDVAFTVLLPLPTAVSV